MVVHHVSAIVSTTSVTNDYDDCNGNNQSLLPSSFAVRFIIIITLFVIIIMNICITFTYKINMLMYVCVFLFADMQSHKLWISVLYKFMYITTFIILVGQI